MSKKLEFNTKMKLNLGILMILGVIGMVWAFFWNDGFNSHARFWSNILLNTYYFAGIAVTGIFFITAHHLGYAGWQTVLKKIPMAMSKFLYVVFPIMVIITIGVFMGEHDSLHNLYTHWASEHGMADEIVAGKKSFLNPTVYAILVLGFFFLWALFAKLMHSKFMSIASLKEYKNTKALSAVFLVIFGVSSSVLSWIVVMSIDPHWYSTLFGWYNLASYFAAGFSMMALIIIYLKSKGLLEAVKEDHIHDIAKYMFGFSVFWTYLWFSQFMLIWYANIPEATVWFSKRFDVPLFKFILIFNLVINFAAPFLLILKRSSKRNFKMVSFVAVLLIIGHYLDFFGMIMLEPMNVPHHSAEKHDGHDAHGNNETSTVLYAEQAGEEHNHDAHSKNAETDHENHAHETHTDAEVHEAIHNHTSTDKAHEASHDAHNADGHHGEEHAKTNYASIGLPEIFIFLGFLGLFLFVVFSTLHDIELEVTEDPFLKESLHHHFDY
ncbi:MAG: hypothetical protein ACPG4Y_03795 [Chitinophagales bacterium]